MPVRTSHSTQHCAHPKPQVDVVGGAWFARAAWVKALFRESFVSLQTGEDYHFSYALGKYAGLRSFVMPFNASDFTFNGVSSDYMRISQRGDTTSMCC